MSLVPSPTSSPPPLLRVVLGSSSKWRKALLRNLLPDFDCIHPDIDEKAIRDSDPAVLCLAIAHAKGVAAVQKYLDEAAAKGESDDGGSVFIISSDQVTFYQGEIREKPSSPEECRTWLRQYSNSSIQTFTAVVVTHVATRTVRSYVDKASQFFGEIPEETMTGLIQAGDVLECAGGFVTDDARMAPHLLRVEGTPDSIIGLPLWITQRLLEATAAGVGLHGTFGFSSLDPVYNPLLTDRIRLADPSPGSRDAAEIAAIYAPYVTHSTVSYEIDPPSPQEMAKRMSDLLTTRPWLVYTRCGTVIGYAYGGSHRARAAYATTSEVSVYVHRLHHRTHVAAALYTVLEGALRDLGYRSLLAGIDLPNAASVAFHESRGFRLVGVYHNVAYKFGRWLEAGWWEADIAPHMGLTDPPHLRTLGELIGGEEGEAAWVARCEEGLRVVREKEASREKEERSGRRG